MKLKPRVLLDCDGVLADFLSPSLDIINQLTGQSLKPEDIKDWDFHKDLHPDHKGVCYAEYKTEGFCAGLKPYPGALEGVDKLREFADVFVVTSPMNGRHWTYERDQWLHKHFSIPSKHIIHAHAKFICTGDILVDDKPSHVKEWQEHNPKGSAVLWSMPYNQDFEWDLRTHDWSDVIDLAKKYV